MRSWGRYAVVGLVLCSLVWSDEALAGAFSIAPTRIQLTPDATTGSLTLTNNSDEDVTVQVETFAWQRTESIADLDRTRDVIAVPPFFDIEPGGEQIIRVGLRSKARPDIEQTYRLVLSEVPNNDLDTNLGVKFALRISLPIFMTPTGVRPEPVFKAERDGNDLNIKLTNEGGAHLRILSLKVKNPTGGKLLGQSDQPLYLLAGQTRDLSVDVKNGRIPEEILISADTTEGMMELISTISP